ncbi:hypothetical protein FB45DRAFT_1037408 [Roridomyces roridus]|uniref:Uncharacterized protein n=1 Tax=Roridomyces roridus TaxID=1738132 RepID=A0AAD7B638_9AGAR|nr:hypothetical protein FB45DRAFT_1037408 [Roridomyces roridus]
MDEDQASKAAVNQLTSSLAVKLGPSHVTVNAILPGFFPSKMTAVGLEAAGDEFLSTVSPQAESAKRKTWLASHCSSHHPPARMLPGHI